MPVRSGISKVPLGVLERERHQVAAGVAGRGRVAAAARPRRACVVGCGLSSGDVVDASSGAVSPIRSACTGRCSGPIAKCAGGVTDAAPVRDTLTEAVVSAAVVVLERVGAARRSAVGRRPEEVQLGVGFWSAGSSVSVWPRYSARFGFVPVVSGIRSGTSSAASLGATPTVPDGGICSPM